MRHRGPDDAGLWCSADARVVFAHRRLSIIDLTAAGGQPLSDASGQRHIVLNGEIYNYRELRAQLTALGHVFRTATDTEVLLAAYARWGTACLDRLIGMFAFAIYDEQTHTVFAARDRAGEKPFYYRRDDHALWFSSEIKALLQLPHATRELDYQALDYYLAYGFVPGERTLVRGIRKLRSAHALRFAIDANQLMVWPYWTLPNFDADAAAQIKDPVAHLDGLLSAAVQRQLVADVPVGILLSGGLDSSLIAALAARGAQEQPKTFTVSFPGYGSYDEVQHARLVAAYLKTDHHELTASPESVDLLPVLARQFDEPIADSSMVPTYLVSRLIREHATVALGGDGGDELFGGYTLYQWVLRQEQLRHLFPATVRRAAATAAAWLLPVGFRGRNYLVGYAQDMAYTTAHINLYFDSDTRCRLVPGLLEHGARPRPEEFKANLGRGQSPIRQLTMTDFQAYLVDNILVKVDRASMLASLEVRAPFLDPGVIDFAFRLLPDELRGTAAGRKIILRKLAARLLPPQFDAKRKQGFSIPIDRWLRGNWGEFLRAVLLSTEQMLFDRREVQKLFDRHGRGLVNGQRLFSLTMLELWRREYAITT